MTTALMTAESVQRELRETDIIDDAAEAGAVLLLGKLSQAKKALEEEKERECRPLLDSLENKRAPYLKAIDALAAAKKGFEAKIAAYRAHKARLAEEENRRRIEAYQAEQRAKEEAARRERERADKLRQEQAALALKLESATEAESVALAAELEKVESKLVKVEAREEIAVIAAAEVAPPVLAEAPSRGVQVGDTAVSFRTVNDWALASGLPRGEDYHRDDVRLRMIPDRYFVLDEKLLSKDVKNGVAVAGVVVIKKPVAAVRTK